MEEIWKDIEGYEGLYQVSNLGNVKSLNFQKRGYEKNITPKLNKKGYLWVILYGGNKRSNVLIHRLVASAFIENPNGFEHVNHKDENPLNNNVDNLEWCTASYNVLYSLTKHPERITKRSTLSRNTPIRQLSKDGLIIRVWENLVSIRHETGWNDWHIEECCKGRRKTAKGYMWEYAT